MRSFFHLDRARGGCRPGTPRGPSPPRDSGYAGPGRPRGPSRPPRPAGRPRDRTSPSCIAWPVGKADAEFGAAVRGPNPLPTAQARLPSPSARVSTRRVSSGATLPRSLRTDDHRSHLPLRRRSEEEVALRHRQHCRRVRTQATWSSALTTYVSGSTSMRGKRSRSSACPSCRSTGSGAPPRTCSAQSQALGRSPASSATAETKVKQVGSHRAPPHGAEHGSAQHRLRRRNRGVGVAHRRMRNEAALDHDFGPHAEERRTSRARSPPALPGSTEPTQ